MLLPSTLAFRFRRRGIDGFYVPGRFRGQPARCLVLSDVERLHEIRLPAEAVADDLAESVKTGIQRYCEARLRTVDHSAREDRSRGWLMLAFSIFVVFALVWVAQQFASKQETLLGVASEGLSIAAWVMLWHPLEHLVFNRWDHRLDGRVLRTVRDHCSVTIAAIETPVATF